MSAAAEAVGLGDTVRIRLTRPQSEMFNMTCRFPLFIGGYGSGKSTVMIARALTDLFDNPGVNIGLYEPTFDLLKLTLIPRIEEIFQSMGIRYNLHKQDHIFSVEGYGNLICRSLDNPNRLIAYEVFRSHVDELDTLKASKANDVWNRIIARQRQRSPLHPDTPNRCGVYTTPEGYRFTYSRWGRRDHPSYRYVRADTRSNPHLPEDYIQSLFDSYPEELAKAYIKGLWVNLTQGSVYYGFNRENNSTKETIKDKEVLHIGMDFNVYKMAASICVEREGITYVLDEIFGLEDTPQICEEIRKRYPGHRVIVYPDATGSRRDTRSKRSDHTIIRKAGFSLRSRIHNAGFSSRALALNVRCMDQKLLVNIEKCPNLVDGLEHQVYDERGQPDKTQDLDHAPDSLGYYTVFRFPVERNTMVEKSVV